MMALVRLPALRALLLFIVGAGFAPSAAGEHAAAVRGGVGGVGQGTGSEGAADGRFRHGLDDSVRHNDSSSVLSAPEGEGILAPHPSDHKGGEEFWSSFSSSSGRKLVGTKRLGEACSQGTDCASGTCSDGLCMETSECKVLKHDHDTAFDVNHVNLVFVASGFESESAETWESKLTDPLKMFDMLKRYSVFDESVAQYSAFYVTDTSEPSFCNYNCNGIEELLCCNIATAQELSDKCFRAGATPTRQTIVVHNSETYGGAGYYDANIATTSTNQNGPLIALHELGHSLFNLGDEYTFNFNVDATESGVANCADPSTACSKWRDLMEHGFEDVQCDSNLMGCSNNGYNIPYHSFMHTLGRKIGPVNERLTCCTYQALAKSMPSYCNKFESVSSVLNFCKNNDYQGYGIGAYDESGRLRRLQGESKGLVKVVHPKLVRIGLNEESAGHITTVTGPSGLYRRRSVNGDFADRDQAKDQKNDWIRVKVNFEFGSKVFYMKSTVQVDVPPPQQDGDASVGMVEVTADSIELAVDTSTYGNILLIQVQKEKKDDSTQGGWITVFGSETEVP